MSTRWAYPHPDPAARPVRPLPLALLVLAAFFGNVASTRVFAGMDLLWGSIFTMIVLRLYGAIWAVLCALVASTWTIVLWGHPWSIALYVAEAVVTGLLLRPMRSNLVLADAVYWIGLGLGLGLLLNRVVLGVRPEDAWLLGLHMAVNGIVNALIANLLIDHAPVRRGGEVVGVPLQRLLFHVLTVLVLGTGLTITLADSHDERKRLDAELAARMRAAARGIEPHLADWLYTHLRVVEQIAETHERTPVPEETQQLLERLGTIFPSFRALYVANAQGITIAFEPRTYLGQSTLGVDYSYRPYFLQARRTRHTVVSTVFYAGRYNEVPVVTLAAPMLVEGRFEGVAVGALDLSSIARLLVHHVGTSNLVATLVRPDGTVVASSSPSIEIGRMYPRATTDALQPGAWFEWIPEPPPYDISGRENATLGSVERTEGPTDWLLVIEGAQGPQYAWLRSRLLRTLGSILALTIVVLPLAAVVSGWITKPLRELARRSTALHERIEQEPSVLWPRSNVREIVLLNGNFRAMARALRERMNDMAAADRAKDAFMAVLGHELRNPLAAIRIAVHMLQTSRSERPREHALGVLDRQSQNLSRIVDDLLDLSRISRGKIELRRKRLDARAVIRDAVEGVMPLVREAKHQLDVRLPEAPLWVDADPTRLEQIVANLLTNAAKYTPSGGHVGIVARAEDDHLVVEVTDDGIGMDAELLARAFEPFEQGAPTEQRSRGGLGIGLTLVRQLVAMHGGRVWAHSEGHGHGSRVGFALPLAPPPEAEVSAPFASEPEGPPRRVLIVDDNADALELLAQTITAWGHEVATARDGPSGIRAAQALRPDLILLDIGLPGLSGLEVARTLRADPAFRDTLIVALTGYGHPEDRERSLAAGFDLHLTKPVDLARLERLLKSLDVAS